MPDDVSRELSNTTSTPMPEFSAPTYSRTLERPRHSRARVASAEKLRVADAARAQEKLAQTRQIVAAEQEQPPVKTESISRETRRAYGLESVTMGAGFTPIVEAVSRAIDAIGEFGYREDASGQPVSVRDRLFGSWTENIDQNNDGVPEGVREVKGFFPSLADRIRPRNRLERRIDEQQASAQASGSEPVIPPTDSNPDLPEWLRRAQNPNDNPAPEGASTPEGDSSAGAPGPELPDWTTTSTHPEDSAQSQPGSEPEFAAQPPVYPSNPNIREALRRAARAQRVHTGDPVSPLERNRFNPLDLYQEFKLFWNINVGQTIGSIQKRILKVTNSVGELDYSIRRWSALRGENSFLARTLREPVLRAELRRINKLEPPQKRDLALYLFDYREGVRMFGVTPDRDAHGKPVVVKAYEDLFTDPFGGPLTSLTGLDKSKGKIETRKVTMEAAQLAIDTILKGVLETPGLGLKLDVTDRVVDPRDPTKSAKRNKPSDLELQAMYSFYNTLGPGDAMNVVLDVRSRAMQWVVRDNNVALLTSKNIPAVPKGIIELNRSPVTKITDGASGAASLKLLDWRVGLGGTISEVQGWLNTRGVRPHELHYTMGEKFSEDPNRGYFGGSQLRVPETGQQKV